MTGFIQLVIYFVLFLPLRFFIRYEIKGVEKIGQIKSKSVIIAANHISRLDPFVLLLLPFFWGQKLLPYHFLTAEKYYNIFLLRIVIKYMGAYPLKSHAWTIDEYLGSTLKFLKKGETVLIFPEGRIMKTGEKIDAKPGLGYLAINNKFSVLPIRIEGMENFSVKKLFFRKLHLKLTLFDPMEQEDFINYENNTAGYRNASQSVMNKIFK